MHCVVAVRLVAVFLLCVAASGCGMLVLAKAERDAAGGSTAANTSADVQFLRDVASVNLAEIATGKLAAQKAVSPQVRKYGQQMAEEHAKANEQAAALAKARGLSLPEEPEGTRQGSAKRLEDLSGEKFDRAYMDQMVKDHGETLQVLQRAAAEAQDPSVRAFAERALPHVRRHLETAQQIRSKL
jgi:putative membrane protein